jgi:hypothetical protein
MATVAGATSIQRRAVRATVLPVQPWHREQPARMDAVYPPFGGEPEPDPSTVDALIEELELQAALLTAVATGGEDFRLKHVQRQYRDRRRRLVDALEQRGLVYPFPWQDLSQWYG